MTFHSEAVELVKTYRKDIETFLEDIKSATKASDDNRGMKWTLSWEDDLKSIEDFLEKILKAVD